MRYENMPPYAPTLMESTRAIGYSIEAAIADIIDNSITAKSTQIDIDFFPIGDAFISILDNGIGMKENELIKAMQYGSKNPLDMRDEDDLGRYGLGMKTASLSQCRVLTVISKCSGVVCGAQWNLNHVKSSEEWSLIILENDELKQFPSWDKLEKYENGTLVIWQDLDKFGVGESNISNAFTRKMDIIRDHLSLVFHRYLAGETGLIKLDIRMNDISIEPKDPFLSKKSTQLMDEEIIVLRGEKVKVKPYILPHTSKLTKKELKELGGKEGLRKQQGFYVYRNKRLLVWGTWFRLMRQGDLSKLARVQVDLPNSLDDLWTLDIKKSTATPPEEVRKNLAVVIEHISEGSKRTWTYRGKKEVSDTDVHLWNRIKNREGGIVYEINTEHPLVKTIFDDAPEIKNKVEVLLKQIGEYIPLNSLYIDLTNDEKINNEDEATVFKMIETLKSLVVAHPKGDQRNIVIHNLIQAEPFSLYADEIMSAMQRGEFDD